MGNRPKRKWNHHNSRLLELCHLHLRELTACQMKAVSSLKCKRQSSRRNFQTKDTTHCLTYLRPAASAASSVSIQQANRSDINPSWTNDGITSSIGSITNGRAALNDCLHGPKQVTTRRIGECIKWGKSPAISLVWKTRSTSITSTPRGMMRRREKRRGYKKKRL